MPYAGAIRALGRTPSQVQKDIVDAIKNRAIEPQAVVSLVEQRTSLISVLGEVNNPNRFPANYAGEHILDSITRAAGPKGPGHETWVMLEREGRRATAPFGALVYEPSNNIWTHPGDTIYLYREPQTFVAFDAVSANTITGGVQGVVNFGEWRISLAEGIGKAGANATSVEISKALNYFRLTVATVNDPIVAATNAYNLNIVARVNNRFPTGSSSSPPF